jgi:hypothetical protein
MSEEISDVKVTRVVKDEDKDGKADTGGPKTTANVYVVQIERSNNEKIPTEAFGFEIPILVKLHGESRVTFPGHDVDTTVDEVEPAYEATLDGDANSILHMLQAKYNRNGGPDVVFAVYRDADELASKAGIAKGKAKYKGPVVSENTDNRKKK